MGPSAGRLGRLPAADRAGRPDRRLGGGPGRGRGRAARCRARSSATRATTSGSASGGRTCPRRSRASSATRPPRCASRPRRWPRRHAMPMQARSPAGCCRLTARDAPIAERHRPERRSRMATTTTRSHRPRNGRTPLTRPEARRARRRDPALRHPAPAADRPARQGASEELHAPQRDPRRLMVLYQPLQEAPLAGRRPDLLPAAPALRQARRGAERARRPARRARPEPRRHRGRRSAPRGRADDDPAAARRRRGGRADDRPDARRRTRSSSRRSARRSRRPRSPRTGAPTTC